MNEKRNDADEASFADLVAAKTVPPPPGHGGEDVYSASTVVVPLPEAVLESLKAAAAERGGAIRAADELVATRRARAFELPVGALATPAPAPAPSAPSALATAAPPLSPVAPAGGHPLPSSEQLASAIGDALARVASEPRGEAVPVAFPPVPAARLAPAPAPVPAPLGVPVAASSLPLASELPDARATSAARSSRSRRWLVVVAIVVVAGLGTALALLRHHFM